MNWETIAILVSLGIALLSMVLALWVRNHARKQSKQLDEITQRIDVMQHASRLQHEELHEVRSGGLAVGTKVKDLIIKVTQLGDKIAEIEYLDPQTRLYTQAAKMVDAGATVDDLMRECELPRAEAELLVSVKKST